MKRVRRCWMIVVLVMALCLGALCPVFASEPSDAVLSQATAIADRIMQGRMAADGADDLQAWVDEVLPGMIGMGGEWYALALRQRGEQVDLSVYSTALQRYLRERESVDGAVTRQRYALALLATGGGDYYLSRVAADTVGQMGHMSYVYGLHLVQNGLDVHTPAADMLAFILSQQAEDGGWSLQGKDAASDVDVTAMTLQALAVYREDADVAAAAERAFAYLSAVQTENGDYYSYGVTCPESGAQVVIALCAWEISVDDGRFVKNGNTLLDGMLQYQLENGCFSHTAGGAENVTATVQSLLAMVAIERTADGRGSLYALERIQGGVDLTDPDVDDATALIDLSRLGVKGWIGVAIVALALLVCFGLLMSGKRGVKHYLSVAIVAVVALLAVLLIDVQSVESYYSGAPAQKDAPVGSVTLSIRCDTVVGQPGAEHLPADGVILPETSFVIEAGDTVFTILSEAAAAHRLRVQNTGVSASSSAMAYISGINDLHEYDFGDLSGWMYFVNGVSPSVGCGEYELSDGDRIEFLYSCSLGEDLK